MAAAIKDQLIEDRSILYEHLKAAMEGHSKQCMGYDGCRVCQTGSWNVLETYEGVI